MRGSYKAHPKTPRGNQPQWGGCLEYRQEEICRAFGSLICKIFHVQMGMNQTCFKWIVQGDPIFVEKWADLRIVNHDVPGLILGKVVQTPLFYLPPSQVCIGNSNHGSSKTMLEKFIQPPSISTSRKLKGRASIHILPSMVEVDHGSGED